MSGPDLTNQIISVLIRFREEHIAFMADIEAMFYQVYVKDHQRDLLRFLWWENGNLDGNLIDHEMCVHVFGATSSPSCSNFALRKTSYEYEETYGHQAAETLRDNFYVDDLLKSVKDTQ